ncbi:ABC transporter permease [Pseudoxanthomonas putridarboris]|uniref:FtsX-like permease family protein n=1 Tax=Pseudoxanthomonas putridarboris TaxID=752605 RepID=A0ABU9J3A0_9GAMM
MAHFLAGECAIEREEMSMHPRLLMLGRHPGLMALLVVQSAIGFVLACSAWSGLRSLQIAQDAPSGIAHDELLLVRPLRLADGRAPSSSAVLDVLRRIRGVERASASNQSPFGYTSSWNFDVSAEHRHRRMVASAYLGDADLLETLGATMRTGRGFVPGEHRDYGGDPSRPHETPLAVVVSATLAQQLYPGQDALGRPVYLHKRIPLHIVGIVEDLPLPVNGRRLNDGTRALFLPLRMVDATAAHFLIRTDASERDRIARDVEQALRAAYPSWVAETPATLSSLRTNSFAPERRRSALIALACAGGILLAMFGSFSTGQWWLQRHVQELSLRRALGASQRQLAIELRLEYFVLTCPGIALGLALSRGVPANIPPSWIDTSPAAVASVSALLIVLVQLAVAWPIRKATGIPPHHVARCPSVRL